MAEDRDDAPGRGADAPGPDFPRLPRLELDELLDQVITRAGEVRATQGRLRGLLRATQHVAAGLELDETLHRLVDAARDLVGSRWAALGLLHEGFMTEVVHRPSDAPLVEMLRHLPADTGVLGWRVDDPRSARVDDLAAHPDALPEVRAHGGGIHSFLRAPVRAGSVTYGNLYLADERVAAFAEDDEQLVVALAAAAGTAVQHAVLLERERRQQRWNQAGTELAMRLLAEDAGLTAGWEALLEIAVEVAGARGATLTTLDPAGPGTVDVVAAAGDVAAWQGRRVSDDKSLTGVVLDDGEPVVVRDAASDPRTSGLGSLGAGVTSLLAAPIPTAAGADAGVQAVLTLTRGADQDAFGDLDIDVVRGFAAQAATILALARARHDRQRLALLEDREQTLTGLQQTVFSQLQRSTMTIANVAGQVEPELQRMLLDQIDALEALAHSIRDTLFDVPR